VKEIALVVALAASLAGCAKADGRADGGPGFSDGALLPDAGMPADAGPDAEPHRSGDPVINEFVSDHASIDECEYVEIAGAPGTDYGRYTLISVEGDAGAPGQVQAVIPIGTTSAGGFWASGFLMDQLQNGSSTLLLVADFAGGTPDIDANNDGAIDNQPWSAIADAVAVHDGGTSDITYADAAVLNRTFDGENSVVGGASRMPDATDTDQPADWVRNLDNAAGLPCESADAPTGEAANTPGEPNHL
jgi:uncharacterized protein